MTTTTREERLLRQWLKEQIKTFRKGKMSVYRQKVLESIPGFSLDERIPSKYWPAGRVHYTKDVRPPMTEAQVLEWMRRHLDDTGKLPSQISGPCVYSPGYSWADIDSALAWGRHGLPGGTSVAKLKDEHFGTTSEDEILAWADAHYARTGRWPKCSSGNGSGQPAEPVHGKKGMNWHLIRERFRLGLRGCGKYPQGFKGFLVARGRLPQSILENKSRHRGWWLIPPLNGPNAAKPTLPPAGTTLQVELDQILLLAQVVRRVGKDNALKLIEMMP